MNDYHNLTGYVSNSSLNLLEKSARQFKKFIDGEYEEKSTSYYDIGTAVHMAILEPEKYKVDVVAMDYTIPKSPKQKEFCKEFIETKKPKVTVKTAYLKAYKNNYSIPAKSNKWEEKAEELYKEMRPYIKYLVTSQNKLVISTRIKKSIKDIKESIKDHQMASKLLIDPSIVDDDVLRFNELQILWEWKGIKCKSMLDRLLIDKEKKLIHIVDVKTTSNITDFKESFFKYHYDRQGVFYTLALYDKIEEIANITKEELEDYTLQFVIVAIDKGTTEIKVFKINESTINSALSQIRNLLTKAKWHFDNKKWKHSMEYYLNGGYDEL